MEVNTSECRCQTPWLHRPHIEFSRWISSIPIANPAMDVPHSSLPLNVVLLTNLPVACRRGLNGGHFYLTYPDISIHIGGIAPFSCRYSQLLDPSPGAPLLLCFISDAFPPLSWRAGILGHACCTSVAVMGGKLLASRISEQVRHLIYSLNYTCSVVQNN